MDFGIACGTVRDFLHGHYSPMAYFVSIVSGKENETKDKFIFDYNLRPNFPGFKEIYFRFLLDKESGKIDWVKAIVQKDGKWVYEEIPEVTS